MWTVIVSYGIRQPADDDRRAVRQTGTVPFTVTRCISRRSGSW
jgi:hypothetical protein